MQNLLTLSFWFNLRPDFLLTSTRNIFFGLLGLLFVGAAVFSLLKKSDKAGLYRAVYGSLSSFCFTNFFLGAVLLFFSYELIPFLAARFWLGLWFVGMAVWLGFIVRKFLEIPKLKQEQRAEKVYKQYIP